MWQTWFLLLCRYPSKLRSPYTTKKCNQRLCYQSKSEILTQHLYIRHLHPLFTTNTVNWWVLQAHLHLIWSWLLWLNDHAFGLIFQAGKRALMFSYGSGLTATMFSLHFNEGQHPFRLSNIASVMNVAKKLKSRHEVCTRKTPCTNCCERQDLLETHEIYGLNNPINAN